MAKTSKPTHAELEILRVLWDRGPCTVRQVHEALAARDTGYTTVLKLMQIMAEKGLARRDESKRAHVYEAVLGAEQARGGLVRDLIDRVFAGSAALLVQQALSAKRATPGEIAEIRRMLKKYEKGERP